MLPFIAYVAAMFLIALPLALLTKSRAAAAVFLVWGIGQLAYRIGLPEPQTQAAIYASALAVTWLSVARSPHRWPVRDVVSALLFAPLLYVTLRFSSRAISEFDWWWSVYYIAVAQIAVLVRPVAWARIVTARIRSRITRPGDDVLRVTG